MIQQAAAREGVDPLDIEAIITQESGGKADALGKPIPRAGGDRAQGMMQLMPATARELGVTDPLDAAQNINAGTKYYAQMLKRYGGDKTKALAAYNWGPGHLDTQGLGAMPSETRNYIDAFGKNRAKAAPPDDIDAFLTANATPAGEGQVSSGDDIDAFLQANAVNTDPSQTKDARPGGGVGVPRPLGPVNQTTATPTRDFNARDEKGNLLNPIQMDERDYARQMAGGMGDRVVEMGKGLLNTANEAILQGKILDPGYVIPGVVDMVKGFAWDTPKALIEAAMQAQSPEGLQPREAGKRVLDAATYLGAVKPAGRFAQTSAGKAAIRAGAGYAFGGPMAAGIASVLDADLFNMGKGAGKAAGAAGGMTAEEAAAAAAKKAADKAAATAAEEAKYQARRGDRAADRTAAQDAKAQADAAKAKAAADVEAQRLARESAARTEREQARARVEQQRQAKAAADAKAAAEAEAKTQAAEQARQQRQEAARAEQERIRNQKLADDKARADARQAELQRREQVRQQAEQRREARAQADAKAAAEAEAKAEAARQAKAAADRAQRAQDMRDRAALQEEIIRRREMVKAQARAEARAATRQQPSKPAKPPAQTGAEAPGAPAGAQPSEVELTISNKRPGPPVTPEPPVQTSPQAPSQPAAAPPKQQGPITDILEQQGEADLKRSQPQPSTDVRPSRSKSRPTFTENDLAVLKKEFNTFDLAEARSKFGEAVVKKTIEDARDARKMAYYEAAKKAKAAREAASKK